MKNPCDTFVCCDSGLLREELGYDGLIVTDALLMGATTQYSPGEAALLALQAGGTGC